jgi:hypothetical protein
MVGNSTLPTDSAARKDIPLVRGLIDYFPAALAAVAELSRIGNEQHNPGQEMHWARGKSSDHADCIVRHVADRGSLDIDNVRHSTKVAWRALALLQVELEEAGAAPLPRGARVLAREGYLECLGRRQAVGAARGVEPTRICGQVECDACKQYDA